MPRPEMLELNRAKVGEHGATYRVVDAFALEASHAHDVVFFGFFLSHVPPSRFAALWSVVNGLLAPGGRAVFVDEADHALWDEDWIDRETGIVRWPLRDGSLHRPVKVLWRPDDLLSAVKGLGWSASVQAEGPFYWAAPSTRRSLRRCPTDRRCNITCICGSHYREVTE